MYNVFQIVLLKFKTDELGNVCWPFFYSEYDQFSS